jgi:hypothetical protein
LTSCLHLPVWTTLDLPKRAGAGKEASRARRCQPFRSGHAHLQPSPLGVCKSQSGIAHMLSASARRCTQICMQTYTHTHTCTHTHTHTHTLILNGADDALAGFVSSPSAYAKRRGEFNLIVLKGSQHAHIRVNLSWPSTHLVLCRSYKQDARAIQFLEICLICPANNCIIECTRFRLTCTHLWQRDVGLAHSYTGINSTIMQSLSRHELPYETCSSSFKTITPASQSQLHRTQVLQVIALRL